ncbi:hypothetical protein HMPREF0660_00841 [Prevotella melaninogenica D18]|nr:hypothetical protein HMPREF0660_00841 [Prevotella melaninogenica D18]
MNEAIKGIRNFIFAGLVLVLSFAAYNKDIETTEAIALTKMVLLATLCRMTPQRLVV